MNKKKVLFTTNVPSPYRVDFFNELGKYVDLTVFFERNTSSERDKSWEKYSFQNFNGIIMNGKNKSVDSAYCPGVIKEFLKYKFDYIFICNFSSRTGIKLINYLIKKKIPYIIESDGGFVHKSNLIVKFLKKRIFSHALYCLSTSDEHDNYYINDGAVKNKIIRYPFSSIFQNEIITFEKKYELKKEYMNELNFDNSKINILTVGRFIEIKGFDVLFKAFSNLNDKFRLYIVGGKPTDEYLNIISELNIKDKVFFVDFIPKKEVLKYMIASDIFVFSSRGDVWGLVINEALSCGTPIICSNKGLAGVEISKYTSGISLYDVEDFNQLSDVILSMNKHDIKIDMLNNIKVASKYTIESMVDRHLSILEQVEKER